MLVFVYSSIILGAKPSIYLHGHGARHFISLSLQISHVFLYVFDGLTSSRIPPPIRTEMQSRPKQLTSATLAKHWRSNIDVMMHTKSARVTARPSEQNAESLVWRSDSPQRTIIIIIFVEENHSFCNQLLMVWAYDWCRLRFGFSLKCRIFSCEVYFDSENIYYPVFTFFAKKKRFSAPGVQFMRFSAEFPRISADRASAHEACKNRRSSTRICVDWSRN